MAANVVPSHGSIELRHLNYQHKQKLADLLDIEDAWKTLMGHIPTTFRPTRSADFRFTNDDISAIQNYTRDGSSPSALFLDEWSTMGRSRPTIQDLLDLCIELYFIRVASYINDDILQNGSIVTLDYDAMLESSFDLGDSAFLSSPMGPEHTLTSRKINFNYLSLITNGFSSGNLIGSGGFSKVYRGVTRVRHIEIAIKMLDTDKMARDRLRDQLNYEIDQLPRLRHPNIIELLGYSNDVPIKPCLLYPCMPNGTVYEKLKIKNASEAMKADQRWKIAVGVARGLNFLHTQQKPLVHRDVKTSNILLDENYEPKLADFGFLRQGVKGDGEDATYTQVFVGTRVYIAPEVYREGHNEGDVYVSVKQDVWAYGVVLLELLTGQNVLSVEGTNDDLVTYVRDFREDKQANGPEWFTSILDRLAGWDLARAELLFKLSLNECIVDDKLIRASMERVLTILGTAFSNS